MKLCEHTGMNAYAKQFLGRHLWVLYLVEVNLDENKSYTAVKTSLTG